MFYVNKNRYIRSISKIRLYVKIMKYALYVNGVLYDYFKTIKEIDEYIFENGLDTLDYNYIEVKRVRKNGRL